MAAWLTPWNALLPHAITPNFVTLDKTVWVQVGVPKIGGTLADLHLYACTIWPRMTKFGMITPVWKGVFLGISHVPIPRSRHQHPQFLWTLTYAHMILPSVTKFNKLTRVSERSVSRGSDMTNHRGLGPITQKFFDLHRPVLIWYDKQQPSVHGYQIRWEEIFTGLIASSALAKNVCDANVDVWSIFSG